MFGKKSALPQHQMATQHIVFEANGIFEFALSMVGFIVMSIMLLHFIKHEWIKRCIANENGFKICSLPPHVLLAMISLMFYLFYTLQSMILSSYYIFYAKPYNSFYPPWCLGLYTHLFSFSVAKIAMYLFWFVRLHQVFKDTLYSISAKRIKIMAACFNIPILITSWYGTLINIHNLCCTYIYVWLYI